MDDLLFSTYTEDVLRELGKSTYKIVEGVSTLENYTTCLPENFDSVRELWLITPYTETYRAPVNIYWQTTAVRPEYECPSCTDNEILVTCKTGAVVEQKFVCQFLLKPGNVHAQSFCDKQSPNLLSVASPLDTFDIVDGKIVTNIPSGYLFMVYYVREHDAEENPMIPDTREVKRYLKDYLKFKCFESLFNNPADETFNQIQYKLQYYENKADISRDIARNAEKQQTIYKAINSIKANRRRMNRFNIS